MDPVRAGREPPAAILETRSPNSCHLSVERDAPIAFRRPATPSLVRAYYIRSGCHGNASIPTIHWLASGIFMLELRAMEPRGNSALDARLANELRDIVGADAIVSHASELKVYE